MVFGVQWALLDGSGKDQPQGEGQWQVQRWTDSSNSQGEMNLPYDDIYKSCVALERGNLNTDARDSHVNFHWYRKDENHSFVTHLSLPILGNWSLGTKSGLGTKGNATLYHKFMDVATCLPRGVDTSHPS